MSERADVSVIWIDGWRKQSRLRLRPFQRGEHGRGRGRGGKMQEQNGRELRYKYEGEGMTEARTHGRVFIWHYRVMWTVRMPLDLCHDTVLGFVSEKKPSRFWSGSGTFPAPAERRRDVGLMWGQGCSQNTRGRECLKFVD